ncbi:MAG: guanylate kinase [Burkholderiaceae bacterium]|jgi:guanylate kinase|nr:guanylate kinase [Burkholderiaceae bacterium]
MAYSGNLFVVSAPSGAGKSSLVKALMEVDARVRPSISHTTRAPRGQEIEGREYFFVSDAAFDALAAADGFLEWAQVHGNRYGTSRAGIEAHMAAGHDVVLEIDWQGALQIRQRFAGAILIFVLPPSLDELRARLLRRGEDAPETIALRLQNAERELAQAERFDYVIINAVFECALFDLKAIVHAQRLRYAAQRRERAETFGALGIA